ncbi:pyridoxamine 5'-phosphate oxidase-domain-containing protein [Aspergillus cavernicola]|uniref:Pyridoxamine 5'-phosphate oxidase-domain-containing protein n=1 Tax=Aspergillus cavernicola TaxID=176166 RepID=A0ABR4IVM3_9EURO
MTPQPRPPRPAPWRTPLLSNLSKSNSTSFSLGTVAYNAANKPIPRSRTVEFRGFWPKPASSLHPSAIESLKTQNVGLNPDLYESDFLSITTDARMGKVPQLADSDDVVEGVFWFPEVEAQWRVRGRAYVVGAPGGVLDGDEVEARGRVEKGMRVKGEGEGGFGVVQGWEWERQITTYFASHTPVMRGSYKNPRPGRPRSEAPENSELKLNQKVEDLNDPVARENFRVLVICPREVERLDFSNPEDVRRTNWTLVDEDGGGWKETELWP